MKPLLPLLICAAARAAMLDLTNAVVVSPPNFSGPEKKAVAMLIDEVAKRTQVRWRIANAIPPDTASLISIGRADRASGGREGYSVRVENNRVAVIGNDSRGVLYGVGYLLRQLHMNKQRITVANDLKVLTAPKYPLRGHQLGYRPKTNSYDGWTLPIWEQYIRDLAVFGTNAIELIPPRSDDEPDSPHFPLPPMQMMTGMSRLADDYGLDVWIWYPAMDPDYSNPKTVEFALNEWGEVFKKLPRVDAVFVPGGDPGHTEPRHLMSLLEKEAQVLHRYHPKAGVWVSPQSFSQAWLDQFLDILKNQQPAWLAGVVFGPQVRISLPKLREAVPKRYPIRHYPDITHSRQCQYPVPDWDPAYSLTEAREVINPRPTDHARIFRLLQPYTIGFITYSEGCNDDVNKMIWSALGWDPEANVLQILREYSRYFIGDRYADNFAQGLLALEQNWRGPLLTNGGVNTTLEQFQSMERSATPQDLLNWRFQQALYRAYYDAYIRHRLLHETELEAEAMARLGQAGRIGSLRAMSEAENILDRALSYKSSDRDRIFTLAEALYQSIRMQLSVPLYKAIAVGRGANLDTVDMPLNSRLWLERRFSELRKLNQESDRLKGIDEIINWTNPGPGGFYDDLGNLTRQPHLIKGPGFSEDPAFLESALMGFTYHPEGPTSWWTHAESLNDTPLRMRYTNLDPAARYKIRVVYAGDTRSKKIRLVANENLEIHPYLQRAYPAQPAEFDIPASATQTGELALAWYSEKGLGGNGRGTQVAEVWLIKK